MGVARSVAVGYGHSRDSGKRVGALERLYYDRRWLLLLLVVVVLLRRRLLQRLALRHWATRYLKGLGVGYRLRPGLRIVLRVKLGLELELGLGLRLRLELGWRLGLWSIVGIFLLWALGWLRCRVHGLLVRVASLGFGAREGIVPALLGLDLESLLLVLVLVVAMQQVAARYKLQPAQDDHVGASG